MTNTNQTTSTPTIGAGCTVCFYTDRHAATIIDVSATGYKVTVREDKATRTDTNGMSECQNYEYAPDPEGAVHVFFRNKTGAYGSRKGGKRLALGDRRAYHDYSF
jgi:hypothetical protein